LFYTASITDEQRASGRWWAGCSDSPIGRSPSPSLSPVARSFPFRGTSFECVWCDTERGMVVERRGGRAAVPSAVMDGNGWMGRGAGDELMRWRAHSMGARAASHRAALLPQAPPHRPAYLPPPLIRGSPSRGDPTRQRGGARSPLRRQGPEGVNGGGHRGRAIHPNFPSTKQAGELASTPARCREAGGHYAARVEGAHGRASDPHRAPEGCRVWCRAPPPALRACPRGHRSRA